MALHNAVPQGKTVPWGTAWCIKCFSALLIGGMTLLLYGRSGREQHQEDSDEQQGQGED